MLAQDLPRFSASHYWAGSTLDQGEITANFQGLLYLVDLLGA